MKCHRPQLIQKWKTAWRLTSVQAMAALVLLNVINAEVLPLFSFALPTSVMNWCNALLGTAAIILRLFVQPKMVITPETAPPPTGGPDE